jgi:hypothetical protein
MNIMHADIPEIRYIYQRVPIYFDIFDKKRVILKLQNPLDSTEINSCITALDPKLAMDLDGSLQSILPNMESFIKLVLIYIT